MEVFDMKKPDRLYAEKILQELSAKREETYVPPHPVEYRKIIQRQLKRFREEIQKGTPPNEN